MNDTPRNAPVNQDKSPSKNAVGQPWHPFTSLRQQIDRLFDEFDRPWHLPFSRPSSESNFWQQAGLNSLPAVDVLERDDSYEISAELPGLDEKDVEVKLVNGNLVIKGEKRQEREEKKKGYYLSERSYGSFQRSFGLPEHADADNISATFKKGVLTLTIPKKPGAPVNEKRIEVKPE